MTTIYTWDATDIQYTAMTVTVKGPKYDEADAWTNALVREYDVNSLPSWAKDLLSIGMPKSVVVVSAIKEDREKSTAVEFGAKKLGPVSTVEERETSAGVAYA